MGRFTAEEKADEAERELRARLRIWGRGSVEGMEPRFRHRFEVLEEIAEDLRLAALKDRPLDLFEGGQ